MSQGQRAWKQLSYRLLSPWTGSTGLIPRELVHDSDARIQVCEDCRQMLVSAPDENLRPRWLDRRGRPRQLSAREHANAFLQPDCHSRAILHFLLEYYDNRSAAEQNESGAPLIFALCTSVIIKMQKQTVTISMRC